MNAHALILESDLVFGEANGTPLLLDLYRPATAPDRPQPAVIWIHGGGWMVGDKWWNTPRPFLAMRGYVLVTINHRLSGEATWPAQIHDAKAAVRWLRANAQRYHVDPDRIGVWGFSSGGHLAALLGTSGDVADLEGEVGPAGHSSRLQAVVDFAGPTDLLQLGGWHEEPNSFESRLLGGPLLERADLARKANPIAYIQPDCPPFLILHGEKDNVVTIRQSELLYEALRTAGVPVEFVRIANGDHGVIGEMSPTLPELEARITTFFDRHLRGGAAQD